MKLSTQRTISVEEAASRLFGTPHMLRPMTLRYLSRALEARLQGDQVIQMVAPAIEAIGPGSSEIRKPYQMAGDGIAVIEISGTLVNRYGWMEGCGFTSYEYLRAQLQFAREDDDVKSIVLRIESPGGECAGAFDLADLIYQIRSEKEVYGVTDDYAYSAGYLMLAQCSKVFVTQTGGTGSVGVIAHLLDATEFDKKMGLAYTVVKAGARKAEGNPHVKTDPATVAHLQEEVDRLYGMFVTSVARGRGMTADAVRRTEAGCFCGPQAVEIGFADDIANIHEVVTMLTAEKRSPGAKASSRMIEGELPAVAAAGKPGNVEDEPAPVHDIPTMPEDEEDEDTPAVEAETQPKEDKMKETIVAPAADQQEQPTPAPAPVAAAAPVAAPVAAPAAADDDDFKLKLESVNLAGVKMKAEYAGMSLADVRADIFKRLCEADEGAPVRAAIKPAQAADSSLSNIEAAAKADAEKTGVTFEQAYVKALRANPAAYAEWDAANLQTV